MFWVANPRVPLRFTLGCEHFATPWLGFGISAVGTMYPQPRVKRSGTLGQDTPESMSPERALFFDGSKIFKHSI